MITIVEPIDLKKDYKKFFKNLNTFVIFVGKTHPIRVAKLCQMVYAIKVDHAVVVIFI